MLSKETRDHPSNEVAPQLHGVHHTARPAWKLEETVAFYRDFMGLDLCHAISARGWGPEDHPDFLHFFFKSGQGSTIAFFYYLGCDKPAGSIVQGSFLDNSTHTAWRVETFAELMAWKEKFEQRGLTVMHVKHEIIESIYVTDPNGYGIEIAHQSREMIALDMIDASYTLEAAIMIENESGKPVNNIEEIWARKALLIDRYLESEH